MYSFTNMLDMCRVQSASPDVAMPVVIMVLTLLSVAGCATEQGESVGEGMPDTSAVSAHGAAEKLDPGYKSVPDDTLTDQNGNRVALSSLRGKIWVADFVFTRCTGPCPMMSQKMSQLQRTFGDSSDVVMVSFSVDPVYDTPAKLAAYAREYGAVEGRWLFLTTLDKNRIWDLAMHGFALSAGEDTTSAGRGMIFHDERMVIVDHNGEIRGYVHSADAAWMDKAVQRVTDLIEERGKTS